MLRTYEKRSISENVFVRMMNRFLPDSIDYLSYPNGVYNLYHVINSGVASWFSCFNTSEGLIFCHNLEPNKFIVSYYNSNFYLLSPVPDGAKDLLKEIFPGSSFVSIDLDY
jgi:hypothetical protein